MSKSILGGLINKTPVPFSGNKRGNSFFSAPSSQSNAASQMGAYGQSGTLFAIVDSLSTETSQVPWKLVRKAKPGQRPEDRVEAPNHLAKKIWDRPNSFMTQQEFVQVIQQHLDLVGESVWIVGSLAPNLPTEIWPVRPDKIKVIPSATDFIAGYIYCGPDGEEVPLSTDEVIMLRMPNPLDMYRGMGPVQSIMTDIDAARYGSEWNRNFFINGAEPGGIVEVPERLTDEEFEELNMRWREQHQGVANAHRVAFLEAGTWKERKFSQRDMQFVELRKVSAEIIREAYRYPKAMLGTTEDVNKAVAEAAETHLARHLIKPRLERIKQALNKDFLRMFGPAAEGLEFDYENPVPDDREADNEKLTTAANAAKSLREAGWHEDDVLAAVGLPPMRYKQPPAPKPVAAPKTDPNTPEEDPEVEND